MTSESDGVAPNEDTTTLTPVTVTTHTNEAGESVYEADYAWAWPWSDSDTGSGKVSPNNKRIYEWNSRNLLMRSVALGYDTRYAYAADGNRAAKWTAGNLSETLYFNTMWTWHIEKGLSQEQYGQYSKHIYLGETRLVTKQTSDLEESYGPSEELHHQYYYHPDHLGSAQLVTDYEGNEYQRIEYTPYGELWVEKKTANEKDMRYLPYKFTAKEQDEETGLYYYGARYLDAKYSRWMSADPAVSDYISGNSTSGGLYNTVNFNLYHYAGNNPIVYTDPDGRDGSHYMTKEEYWEFVIQHSPLLKFINYMQTRVNNSNVTQNTPVTNPAPSPNPTVVAETLSDTIRNIGVPAYSDIPYQNNNSCDEFVANVLRTVGVDPGNYFLGNTDATVLDHITEMNATGQDFSVPGQGANVVFMGDGHNNLTRGHEHAGLLILNSDNSIDYYDNSRNNPGQRPSYTHYDSIEAFQNDYGYDTFYYQPIE